MNKKKNTTIVHLYMNLSLITPYAVDTRLKYRYNRGIKEGDDK